MKLFEVLQWLVIVIAIGLLINFFNSSSTSLNLPSATSKQTTMNTPQPVFDMNAYQFCAKPGQAIVLAGADKLIVQNSQCYVIHSDNTTEPYDSNYFSKIGVK